MHQTKYRGIITEAGSLTTPPWEPVFRLVKPPIKSVSPFGGDLCFGWLGSPRLYLYKPLGCVSALWKWIPAGKDKMSDGKLMETQTANYFSDIYPIDCAVLSANA